MQVPGKDGKMIDIDEGQMMAVKVDKKSGEHEISGMMNIGGKNDTGRKEETDN
jgi:hypothetical protein